MEQGVDLVSFVALPSAQYVVRWPEGFIRDLFCWVRRRMNAGDILSALSI